MTNKPDFDSLDRSLSGESDAPAAEPLAGALRASLRPAEARQWDSDQSWSRLSARFTEAPVRHARRRVLLLVAAVLVVGFGLGVTYRVWLAQRSAQPEHAALREYRTAPGQRDSVQLPDGSRVVLAAASVLRVPASFSANGRVVQLEGEAYFDVTHDEARPFTVLTRNAQTRVLGTSFTVSEYNAERSVEVVVVTGRVLLQPNRSGAGAVLAAGMAGTLGADDAVSTRTVDVADYTGWKEGRLVFRDRAFSDVVPQLERWYGVDIEVAHAGLAATHMTALFDKQSLPDVLDVLAATLNAQYQRNGNRIVFSRN